MENAHWPGIRPRTSPVGNHRNGRGVDSGVPPAFRTAVITAMAAQPHGQMVPCRAGWRWLSATRRAGPMAQIANPLAVLGVLVSNTSRARGES